MLRLLFLLALALAAAGCDTETAGAQFLFEEQALYSAADGITETRADGRVVARDADDWRIGPDFINRVSILELPYPNPVARGDGLNLLVDTRGVPGGLALRVVAVDPGSGLPDLFSIRDPGATRTDATRPGLYSFLVSANQIALGQPGLYRLVLQTGTGAVVSYGDIRVVS